MATPRERLTARPLALGPALTILFLSSVQAAAHVAASQPSPQPAMEHSAAAAAAQAPAADATQPTALAFDPPSVEFGAMYVGKTRHAKVKVTNSSADPVTISNAIPGCSCTKVSEVPKEPLAPGASVTIEVSLDGGDYGGTKLRKVVNFLIDGRPTEFLWLNGEVQKVIGVTPQVLDVRKATDGDTLKVRLESARFMDFTVRGVEPVGIVMCGTEPSTEHELSIDVAALKAAGMPTKLTVTTDHPDADTIFVLLRVPPRAAAQDGAASAPAAPTPPAPPAAPAPPAQPAAPAVPAAPSRG